MPAAELPGLHVRRWAQGQVVLPLQRLPPVLTLDRSATVPLVAVTGLLMMLSW